MLCVHPASSSQMHGGVTCGGRLTSVDVDDVDPREVASTPSSTLGALRAASKAPSAAAIVPVDASGSTFFQPVDEESTDLFDAAGGENVRRTGRLAGSVIRRHHTASASASRFKQSYCAVMGLGGVLGVATLSVLGTWFASKTNATLPSSHIVCALFVPNMSARFTTHTTFL